MTYRAMVALSLIALIAIQAAWQLAFESSARVFWLLFGLAPLLACLTALALRRPTALFWSGVLALLYFCHGVMEGWTVTSDIRWLAVLEAAVAMTLVLAVGADGLARRRAQRAKPGPL
ncbi:DUF2069 domain-containing protein [Pseudomarimonas arenosa]|uniref:DUF2069 domain-containing protein n=1 Tax=Pseudomarimonas arenosa TaxID=2774145 RepID=A0AAW3ZJC3_9GAMM|nr:DUF2069 domain-containing protein [Pseudomarimonas arenosa]MBD8525545.1 DUF2069 domain-containing protein [Pseudomarimonas arenosa]